MGTSRVDYQQLEAQSYPQEIKACEFTEPLCNNYIKIRNIKVIQPYNFFMSPEQWAKVERINGLEFRLALKFGLENDIRAHGPHMIDRLSFHTMMYIKFHEYVRKNSLKEVSKLVAEFQSATFTARTTSVFSAAKIMTVKGLMEKSYSVADTYLDARELIVNKGPLIINRALFIEIFKKDYDIETVNLYKQQGIYKGDTIGESYSEIGY